MIKRAAVIVQRKKSYVRFLIASSVVALGAVVSCRTPSRTTQSPQASASSVASIEVSTLSSTSSSTLAMPTPLVATSIDEIEENGVSPRLVRNQTQALVISAPKSASGRRWVAHVFRDQELTTIEHRHEIAEAPENLSAWDIQPTENEGYILAWAQPISNGTQIRVVTLNSQGTALTTPSIVAFSPHALVAVRILNGTSHTILTYGERIVERGSSKAKGVLWARALDLKMISQPTTPIKIAENLVAWHIQNAMNDGLVVAYIQREESKKREVKTNRGQNKNSPKEAWSTAMQEDCNAYVTKINIKNSSLSLLPSIMVANHTASHEIETIFIEQNRSLVVWADRRTIDVQLRATVIDWSASMHEKVDSSHTTITPHGDLSLVGLFKTKTGPVLAYEVVYPRPTYTTQRRFELVRLSMKGEAISKPRIVEFPYHEQQPEMTITSNAVDDEVVVLTSSQKCLQRAAPNDAKECNTHELAPFVLRFSGPTLSLQQSDMLDVNDSFGGIARRAFDLQCYVGICSVLFESAKTDDANSNIRVGFTSIKIRKEKLSFPHWVYNPSSSFEEAQAKLIAATTIDATSTSHTVQKNSTSELQLSGLHAIEASSEQTWIAWATTALQNDSFSLSRAKNNINSSAMIFVRSIVRSEEFAKPASIITERAVANSPIAIAAADASVPIKNKDVAGLVAYVSSAEGNDAIYIAKLNSTAQKIGPSIRITNTKGAASEIALLALPPPIGGYMLAWVEAQKNNGIYALRLDAQGRKMGSEVILNQDEKSSISHVSLTALQANSEEIPVAVVWSDSRNNSKAASDDIYYSVVSANHRFKPIVSERVLAQTPTYSHHPVVSALPKGGALIGWLEDNPQSTDFLEFKPHPEWGAYMAILDSQGATLGTHRIETNAANHIATSIAVDCKKQESSMGCVVGLAMGSRTGIDVFTTSIDPTRMAQTIPANTVHRVWSFQGAPTQDVSLTMAHRSLFLCEDGPEPNDGRVRKLDIFW